MNSKLVPSLIVLIMVLIAGLAFMLGRQTTPPLVADNSQVTRAASLPTPTVDVPKSAPLPTLNPSPKPRSEYPKYVSSIPAVFRGRWDEIISDKCEAREARFYIAGNSINNFEVQSDVSQVKLYSATEADITITGYDDDKNQYTDTMMLKVIDGGRTLTGRKSGAGLYHKCPD